MTIDKSWIHLGKRNSPEFIKGLCNFIEIARNHVDKHGKAYCPCRRCANAHRHDLETIYAHVHDNGFLPAYQLWNYHGEKHPNADKIEALFKPRTQTNPTTTNNEMLDVIHDVMREQQTNEENIVDDDTYIEQGFDALFKEVNTELYPGCSWMSSLDFLAKLMHLKVINNWTNSSFDQILKLFRDVLPKEAHIPASHCEAKKKMTKIGLGYECIHACKYDCALFWKENASLENCPICNESRWDDKNPNGKKIPQKVLRYFPLTPRLRRMYGSRFTAKDMTWHNTGRSTDGMMRHPVDGKAWQDFNKRYPDFAKEPRNVRLCLAADGFDPFVNQNQPYSMWPVVLTTYNTPPWLCMKESSFMLTLLIPGSKSPGTDIDIFLRPLVDELKMLWAEGVQTRDVSTNDVFKMRAALLWTINDFPARSILSGWSGQGYKACPTCNLDTPSCRVIGKTSYVGHRRFLPSRHKLRENLLFDGKKETRGRPRRLSTQQILDQLKSVSDRVPGKHPSNESRKRKRNGRDASETNWTKQSIFFELDYWSSLELKHNLDVMHVEKNVCESLLGTLLMNEKSKDTYKARQDLQNMNIRPHLWLIEKNNKFYQPHPPYSFKPSDRERFCQFIKSVRLPDGFGSNFKNKVSSSNSNMTGLKSHDYHILMQLLLPIGVRAGLPPDVSTAITNLCTYFKMICARSLHVEDMRKEQKEVIKILCNLELIYPPVFFDIMVHLVIHLAEEAILGGPVFMRWMYPFERYMKKLKAYIKNKAKPEGSIAEGYVVDEALTFCSMYLDGMQTKFNRPDRNADAGIPKRQLLVFSSQCRPISKKEVRLLCSKAKKSLEWFVLNNCDEIKDYKSKFESDFPNGNMKTEFSIWFKSKANLSSSSSSSMSLDYTKELKALAHGPLNAYSYTACIVNGVRFVAHNRDRERATQNSGVVSIGEDGTIFYGQLEDIVELIYIDGYSVVLFRCKWYDTSGTRLKKRNNVTVIDVSREWFVGNAWYDDQQYILATQAKQVFYLQDPSRNTNNWKVVEEVHHRKIWDYPSVSVENEVDVLHDTQSSNYNLDVDLGSEVGEPSARLIDDDTDVLRDIPSTQCNLVIDLGHLPMRTPLVEESDTSPSAPILDNEMVVDDDQEDDHMHTSGEEDEMTHDKDDDDNDDRQNTLCISDDSD